MQFAELARIINGKTLLTSPLSFQFIATDSRLIKNPADTLFFARKGPTHDGHAFVRELYEQGVRLFVLEHPAETDLPEAGILQVDHSLIALQQLAAYHRKQFAYPVIGITGSNGKTTVKEWLASLLQDQYSVVKSPKSYNSQLGVPLSIMEMRHFHELAIFEAGISRAGEMDKLARQISPQLGIFTNIGTAHAEGFSRQEQKVREKAQLFQSCQHIICRRDHVLVWSTLKELYGSRVKSWSLEHPLADIKYQLAGHQLILIGSEQGWTFDLPFSTEPQLENLLHALTTGLLLGVEPELLKKALPRIRDIDMRLTLKSGLNGCYLVDDCYNNDLAGLEVALGTMDQQRQKNKKTVILSDILQSGLSNDLLYHQVNDLLAHHHVHRLIGIGPQISASADSFKINKSFFPDTQQFLEHLPELEDEIVLVKGARQFHLEEVVKALEEQHHGTSLTIHFESVLHNLNTYRKLLRKTKLMVMVKAHGYGGGSEELANFLQYHQVDYLGVAYVNEGINLQKNGIKIPIMVMNPDWDSLPLFARHELEPEIYSLDMLRHFIRLQIPVPIHLKLETGMNRLGFHATELEDAVHLIRLNQLKVQSIFTHLAGAEDPDHDDFTKKQVHQFELAYQMITEQLGYLPIRHVLNSGGIVRWTGYHFDMVRLGIGLHGIDPSGQLELQPISTFKTRVSQVKNLTKGETVGYGRYGVAEKDLTMATIPVGYADGYRRSFGRGKAYVTIQGEKAFTMGNICMDMSMVDVTGLNIKKGDEVVLFGHNPSIYQLAEWAETIPYEILTAVSSRVKRVYTWD